MKRLIPLLLIAASLSAQKYNPATAIGRASTSTMGAYCSAGFTQIPETMSQQLIRYFFNINSVGRVHVQFGKSCGTLDHWRLFIKDINDPQGDGTIRLLKTANESPTGMDIEGLRGHWIDWRINTF